MITVDEKTRPWHAGMTVEELLAHTDEARSCAVVRLNGRLVSRPKFAETPVPDGARVVLIPMVVGG